MRLITCPGGRSAGSLPVVQHPCGRAARALDDAGHVFEVQKVGGFKALPFTRRGRRDEVRELTGQEDVPVLVTDDGEAVAGARAIVAWARAHPAR